MAEIDLNRWLRCNLTITFLTSYKLFHMRVYPFLTSKRKMRKELTKYPTYQKRSKKKIHLILYINSLSLSVSQWQGYTQLTADEPVTSVNKTQMIESNCGPSGWSSCSANVFFLLSSPAYGSSPSLACALSRSLSPPIGAVPCRHGLPLVST
jgi:hypothetical protein